MRNIRKIFNTIKVIPVVLVIVVFGITGCEEATRYEISGNDSTPPSVPVFVKYEALPGGAKVFFRPPADHDVLYIEASYINTAGKKILFAASFAAGSVDVYGFDKEGEHAIELCAVDRAGNRSESIHQTVKALEPPAATLAKSLSVLPSFSSMLLKWKNEAELPLYVWVDIAYTQNGARYEHTAVFNTYQSEMRSIDSLKLVSGEKVAVKVNVRDKYDNVIQAKDTSIVLLTDEVLPKDKWKLLAAGTEMGGVKQVVGVRLEQTIDGVIDIDIENFFQTLQANPWSLIIDLGEEYELSRILTHQRWSGFNVNAGEVVVRGNLYRGANVFVSNLYRWVETDQSWERMTNRLIPVPVVKTEGEYLVLGKNGDIDYIYPEEPQFSKPTRYFRLEAVNGKEISEITLYGRKAK